MTSHCLVAKIPFSISALMLKVLIIGDYGVGKTAIVRRYSEGKFSSNYKITIGAEFSIKNYVFQNKTRVNVQLWDIAGQERFGYMTRVYYKNASAAVIVFDLSRALTFHSVNKWLKDVREKITLNDGTDIPVVILANKTDIAGITMSADTLDTFCRKNNVIGWYQTSAKNNLNIDDAMEHLLSETITEIKNQNDAKYNDNISLHKTSPGKNTWLCC